MNRLWPLRFPIPSEPEPAVSEAIPGPGEAIPGPAEVIEQRLRQAGVQLTMGGEPTLVPLEPDGAEWSVAADGPTKLGYARALAKELQRRAWPDSTLLYCPGKRYDGEVNPRWALRLIRGGDGGPLALWPRPNPAAVPRKSQALKLLAKLGKGLGIRLHPLALRDPLQADRRIWAIPLSCEEGRWHSLNWPLAKPLRQLSAAQGPAGLRLPLQHFPEQGLRQVLTLELDQEGWGMFLPPLAREPLEQLLELIARHSSAWQRPELSGVLPVDCSGHWQVLGLTADPGVLEVNLPVCPSWQDYAEWILLLEQAAAAVGLRCWREQGGRREGTGGGNHLLLGWPSLETNPFFARPAWLVGILRYWQHHPCLAYLFSGRSVGPASQAPRTDEGSASPLDLELAHRALEHLPPGDQRVAIGETLRHLHADRSGNTHRSEISLDKFWNPAWTAGCQGLLEFRALESLPEPGWTNAVALLWRALAVHLLEPAHRPSQLRDWGPALHDQLLLPSQLWSDLEQVLAELAAAGLALDPKPFAEIWQWRFPQLLHWQEGTAELTIRRALEPWPLLCDTPVEGGSTSRFVDSSLRRFELITSPDFRRRFRLELQGRAVPLPAPEEQGPLAVRYRQEALFPCLHPCLPEDVPLELELSDAASGTRLQAWRLEQEEQGFEPIAVEPGGPRRKGPSLRGPEPDSCSLDLRL